MNAKIAKNKSLLKEYECNGTRTVYLKDGDEFQIQLFNSETTEIGAEIYINNERLSNIIILRPGERVWLERFTDKPQKFKFSTYNIDINDPQVSNAIKFNGEVTVKFYKKMSNNIYYSPNITWTYYNSTVPTYRSTTTDYSSITASSVKSSILSINDVETGRIEEGSHSNQKFNSIDMNLESYPSWIETIKILPESQKPIYSDDLHKIYCTNCGRKLKTMYKYCPYCGTKIE